MASSAARIELGFARDFGDEDLLVVSAELAETLGSVLSLPPDRVNQAEWAKGAAKPAVVLPPGARYHLGKIICAHLESKTPDPDGAPKKRARASFAEPAPKPTFSLP